MGFCKIRTVLFCLAHQSFDRWCDALLTQLQHRFCQFLLTIQKTSASEKLLARETACQSCLFFNAQPSSWLLA